MREAPVQKRVIALAGNPNVGKSTLFNALTGGRQHTGNWSGKTVGIARGDTRRGDIRYEFVDLPGTYALDGGGEDERLAAEYICSGEADCTVVICDGSCLQRSLILALQILRLTEKVVVCVNLMDEARKNGIVLDGAALSQALGVPVVLTAAGKKEGLDALLAEVSRAELHGKQDWQNPIEDAQRIAEICTRQGENLRHRRQEKIDRILVSPCFGIPLMLLLLLFIIWITIWGANYPSALLESLANRGYTLLKGLLSGAPGWLSGALVDGMYATAARVICVMLPPMAIFFPLFTVLEDIGYLPRIAFLLDGGMRRCGGCGKQALTLCMGLGCNAVGVMGCRILESPGQRTRAILTNAMVPCNGRFPTLILLGSLFFSGGLAPFSVALCILAGVFGAMAASGALHLAKRREEEPTFVLELPPFRKPKFLQILVRSLVDRTLHISLRALKVAAPAGLLLWILANTPLLSRCAGLLDPLGRAMGMNGVILLAFVFSFPANELFIPVTLLTLTGAGSIQSVSDVGAGLLLNAGWTWQTAVCTMAFCLFHWPCATTLMTVYSETRSKKETAAAFFLPTAVGILLCVMLNLILSAI